MRVALAGWLWRAQFRAQPGRVLAATLAIAIGVALALAIHLVNRSALAEFDAALAVVNGEAQARIEAQTGSFDENLWPRIADSEGIAAASPVVEASYRVVSVIRGGTASDPGAGSPSSRTHAADRPELDESGGGDARRLQILGIDVLRINAITPKSPAEAARLKVGDVILSFDGNRVEDDTHLINLVSLTPVGTEAELRVLRGSEILAVKVTVGNRAEIE